jgi:hypothetical protein
MPLTDPRARAVGYLILRHLYDGDVIEWPVAEDHAQHAVFAELEQLALVARWDRVWPLHDRYRLTDRGIQAIEAVYKPAGAEQVFESIRGQHLPPDARRAALKAQGLDPDHWGILHDPWTHWSTFLTSGARWHTYLWEDRAPPRMDRRQKAKALKKPPKIAVVKGGGVRGVHVPHVHGYMHGPRVVDLDREANDPAYLVPEQGGYDVS